MEGVGGTSWGGMMFHCICMKFSRIKFTEKTSTHYLYLQGSVIPIGK